MPNENIEDWRVAARYRIAAKLFPRPQFEPEQHPAADSYRARLSRQVAAFEWCAFHQDFEFFVTIQFGEQRREQQTQDAVKRIGALFDFHWLGRAWANRSSDERTYFVAIVEQGKKQGNTHVHMLVRRPHTTASHAVPGWRHKAQARCLSRLFTSLGRQKGICPHGDIRFDRIWNEDDQVRVAGYVLKELWGRNSTGLILSHEFHPLHQTASSTATRPRS